MTLRSARSAAMAGTSSSTKSATALAASRAKAFRTTFGFIERILLNQCHGAHRRHDHLCDPVAPPDLERLLAVVDEDHLDLAAIVRIDCARRIEHGDAVFDRKPRSGTDLGLKS